MPVGKRLIRWIALGVAGLALLLGVAGFFMPAHVNVERSVSITAMPTAIYPLLSNFRTGWTQWNAFDDEDPDISYSYSGPDEGVGAVQIWTSKKMGDGRMTLVKADPEQGIDFELQMGDEAFTLKGHMRMIPESNGTRLTWVDVVDLGGNPYRRLMGPIITNMIGEAFETSLSSVKQLAESAAPPIPIPLQ